MRAHKFLLMAAIATALTWGFTACEEKSNIDRPGDNSHNLADRILPDEGDIDPVDSLITSDGEKGIPEGITVLSIKEALAKCKALGSNNSSSEKVYVMGYVYQLETSKGVGGTAIDSYGSAYFRLKDKPTDIESFYCYRVYWMDGNSFEKPEQVQVNQRVIVYCNLKNYGGNVYETLGDSKNRDYVYSTTFREPPVETVGDGSYEKPYTVGDVLKMGKQAKGKFAYVRGFINGAAVESARDSIEFAIPEGKTAFSKASNVVLSELAGNTNMNDQICIDLPTGDLRKAVNLRQNAANLGAELLVYGRLTTVMDIYGLDTPTYVEVNGQPTGERPQQ